MYSTFTGMYMYMHVCYVCTTLHEAIHKAAQVEYLLAYLLHVNSTGALHALPSTDLRVRKDLLYKPIVGVLHKAYESMYHELGGVTLPLLQDFASPDLMAEFLC